MVHDICYFWIYNSKRTRKWYIDGWSYSTKKNTYPLKHKVGEQFMLSQVQPALDHGKAEGLVSSLYLNLLNCWVVLQCSQAYHILCSAYVGTGQSIGLPRLQKLLIQSIGVYTCTWPVRSICDQWQLERDSGRSVTYWPFPEVFGYHEVFSWQNLSSPYSICSMHVVYSKLLFTLVPRLLNHSENETNCEYVLYMYA